MDKLTLLRRVVANLHVEPHRAGLITQDDVDRSPFAKARLGPQGTIGVLKAGGEALSDLAEEIFQAAFFYEHGSTFEEVSATLFDVLIQEFLQRKGDPITAADLVLVEETIEAWFNEKSASFHFYIPCILTPRPAAIFEVGPVRFTFASDFIERERMCKTEDVFETDFGDMLRHMDQQRAFWVAEVDVDRSMPKRARELGELAVDIAVAGLQIVIHPQHSRHMARLTARTVPRYRYDVSTSASTRSPSVTNQEPGLALGPGTLDLYLSDAKSLLIGVGTQISAFLYHDSALPTLTGAWTDSAYWFHEGLAEPLDTIAVPKLETAIEVLLRSEKSSGSEARVCRAIQVFYGLKSDEFINPTSTLTVKQFAKGFVRDRSMILHGTLSTLRTSLRASRASLEGLVVGLLAHYLLHLQEYKAAQSGTDKLDAFLAYVEGKR